MAHGWGQEITEAPPAAAEAVTTATARPSIRWRWHPWCCRSPRPRWPQQVTVTLVSGSHAAELHTLTPDQLLDLQANEDLTN